MKKFQWSLLIVLSLALAIIILDTTILNVALASIIQDLHTDIQSIQWVITAYSLTLAALTITGGRLGDLFGRKRMFMFGAFLFAVGSFIASVSPNVAWLITGESIIEGIGAALMMPATSSLLVANFEGRDRAIAFGVWGGIAGASAALGPILGGFLTTNYSWRWGFRVNLIVVALLLIGAMFVIPESRDDKERKRLDIFGVFLSALGMLSLVFGLIESSRYGWWKAKETFVAFGHTIAMPHDLSVVPAFLVIGFIVLALFLAWELFMERRGKTPLVSPSIFLNRGFFSGTTTVFVMSLGQTGLIFSLPVFLQSVRGLDAYHTGLSLLPMTLPLLIVSPLAAAASKKISPKVLICLGLLLNAGAYLVMRSAMTIDTTGYDLIPGLVMYGVGMGLVMSQINNLTLSSVPTYQAGEASGVMNSLRQVGSTFGSAVMGAILVGALGTQLVSGVMASDVLPNTSKQQIADAVQSQASNVEFGGGAQLSDDMPQAIRDEVVRIGHEATVTATKKTLVFGSIFAAFGFVAAAVLLPNQKRRRTLGDQSSDRSTDPFAEFVESQNSTNTLHATSQRLSTDMIAKLIAADEKQPGAVAGDVQLLLNILDSGKHLHEVIDPRFAMAQMYWKLGVGQALGLSDFSAYFDSLPPAPMNVWLNAGERLLLVDRRLSASKWCAMLNVTPKIGNDHSDLPSLATVGAAEWVVVAGTATYLGKSMNEATASLAAPMEPADLMIGLSLLAIDPAAVETQCLDLPNSRHDHAPQGAACLGTWGGERQLRWRWLDHADPRCGTLVVRRG